MISHWCAGPDVLNGKKSAEEIKANIANLFRVYPPLAEMVRKERWILTLLEKFAEISRFKATRKGRVCAMKRFKVLKREKTLEAILTDVIT